MLISLLACELLSFLHEINSISIKIKSGVLSTENRTLQVLKEAGLRSLQSDPSVFFGKCEAKRHGSWNTSTTYSSYLATNARSKEFSVFLVFTSSRKTSDLLPNSLLSRSPEAQTTLGSSCDNSQISDAHSRNSTCRIASLPSPLSSAAFSICYVPSPKRYSSFRIGKQSAVIFASQIVQGQIFHSPLCSSSIPWETVLHALVDGEARISLPSRH